MDHLKPRSDEEKFLTAPYESRWELLKPVIVELYMEKRGLEEKSMTMRQVAEFMRDNYSFYAAETQYKHKFRYWGFRKRTLAAEKNKTVSALGKRARPGTSTSDVTLSQGGLAKPVDSKQLKRHLHSQIRHYEVAPLAPGVLTTFNMPYQAYIASFDKRPDLPSPFGTNPSPGLVNVPSPKPSRALSPTMHLVNKQVIQERSNLLLQGRFQELLPICREEDRILLADYLHDFYIHSFVTAKYWGRGPKKWDRDTISAFTLGNWNANNSQPLSLEMEPSTSRTKQHQFDDPSQLCRWSIHVKDMPYEEIPQPESKKDEFDLENPSSWADWRQPMPSFTKSMQEAVTQGGFTSLKPGSLPVSTELITQSLERDPDALKADALKLAIMAGNTDLLEQLLGHRRPREYYGINPCHIAAAFIDGGKSCCGVMATLNDPSIERVDNFGHTVLDALMISILRSHTTVPPRDVSSSFRDILRYPGEEKDICGRWDADSPAVRNLFQNGYSRIPTAWKHPFCHTSAQAVVHNALPFTGHRIINQQSGLFLRHCGHCGLELKLQTLHALVVVSFYLAERGRPGETMFGALALLVSFVVNYPKFLQNGTAEVSIEDILGTADPDRCYHQPIDACGLMEKVPHAVINRWSEDCQIGWKCILQTFRLDMQGRIRRKTTDQGDGESGDTNESDKDNESDDESMSDFNCMTHGEDCPNPELGLLWACIQTEFLTYRRIEEGDPWISRNFSMRALLKWLNGESAGFNTPLVEDDMMKKHNRCGQFDHDSYIPVAEDVCKEHFMNMDDYKRTSFIPQV